MPLTLSVISSMATRGLLAELVADYQRQTGVVVHLESVGGVDAAKRVAAGEVFDVVALASDAIDKLMADGHLVSGSRVDLVRSEVAIAVADGAAVPAVDTLDALKAAVSQARRVGYSTGPSGVALKALVEAWGLGPALVDRLVQSPPGVPVARMVAEGAVDLGFQQLSEMLGQPGIRILGAMPPGAEITTVFSAALAANGAQADAARALIDFLHAPAAAVTQRRHGMSPA